MSQGRQAGNPAPSEGQWEILGVLWFLGSGTVEQVREQLAEFSGFEPAHTTVQTQLRRLARKGCVRTLVDGPAHRFVPLLRLDDARQDALHRLIWIYYGGDAAVFARDFASNARLTPQALWALGRIAQERLRTRRTPSAPARPSAE